MEIELTGRLHDRYRVPLEAARGPITLAHAARVLHGVRLHVEIAGYLAACAADADVPYAPVARGAVHDPRVQRGDHVLLVHAVKRARVLRYSQIWGHHDS